MYSTFGQDSLSLTTGQFDKKAETDSWHIKIDRIFQILHCYEIPLISGDVCSSLTRKM